MPLSSLRADIDLLGKEAGRGKLASLAGICFDSDTDEIRVTFQCGQASPATVCILCGDIDAYPKSQHYFLSDDAQAASSAVQHATDRVSQELGLRGTAHTLAQVVRLLAHELEVLDDNAPVVLDSDDEDDDDDDDEDDSDDDAALYDVDVEDPDRASGVPGPLMHEPAWSSAGDGRAKQGAGGSVSDSTRQRRLQIAHELQRVYSRGFLYGVVCGMTGDAENNIVAVSIRVADLFLSPQMLLAWNLDPAMYLVLLVRYERGYRAYGEVAGLSNKEVGLSFRVGKCLTYKPSVKDACAAFGTDCVPDIPSVGVGVGTRGAFQKILFSAMMGSLMSDSFLRIARLRHAEQLSWADAVAKQQTRKTAAGDVAGTQGHESASASASLLELAMDFAVDQLKTCTQYCQSCHVKLNDSMASYKPTTCRNALCQYQHMEIGLGQYVEFEILVQPVAVDLLINMCYSALSASRGHTLALSPIRVLPNGLRLKVPDITAPAKGVTSAADDGTVRIMLMDAGAALAYTTGQWVGVAASVWTMAQGAANMCHGRIASVDYENATIAVSFPSFPRPRTTRPTRTVLVNGTCFVFPYTLDFDRAPADTRTPYQLLLDILDTLPTVEYIKTQLELPHINQLSQIEALSPAAVSLLEWIMVTNKSCITQITTPDLMVAESSQVHRTVGPPADWLQFCFIHGSPEAEAAFERETQQLFGPPRPGVARTLFAWHGSTVHNWHSIVRNGLDCRVVAHGRSYGDGVYFAPVFETSLAYARNQGAGAQWPSAVTDVQSIVSLNELVNAPAQYMSALPHYVLNKKNWSRCRFLFVKANATAPTSAFRTQKLAQQHVAQALRKQASLRTPRRSWYVLGDPARPAYGPTRKPIVVPHVSMPSWQGHVPGRAMQRSKAGLQSMRETMDAADRAFLNKSAGDTKAVCGFTESDIGVDLGYGDGLTITKIVRKRASDKVAGDGTEGAALPTSAAKRAATAASVSGPTTLTTRVAQTIAALSRRGASGPSVRGPSVGVTPFVPNTLDFGSLRMMQPPSWGTATAQRALASSLRSMRKVQASTPAAELGWFMAFDKVDNLFQWVVELHSFDTTIPLAADMARQRINSIVAELRFGPDFPVTPPFVRVVRPRFLPLAAGGGGHITAGGSVCMELLTTTGWLPTITLESVLLQVRLALTTASPPARLESNVHLQGVDYGIAEAMAGYMRSAATHGWRVPADMQVRGR